MDNTKINTTTNNNNIRRLVGNKIAAASASLASGACIENQVSRKFGTSAPITTTTQPTRTLAQPQAEIKARKATHKGRLSISDRLAQAKGSLETGSVENWTGMKFASR